VGFVLRHDRKGRRGEDEQMNELPKILTFKMPAEASPLGYRQKPANPLLEVDRLRKTFPPCRGRGGRARQLSAWARAS
jgi:hypothetical protein